MGRRSFASTQCSNFPLGHVPFAAFGAAGQAAVTAALDPAFVANGLFLFYVGLSKFANRRLVPGSVIQCTVGGNQTRFGACGRLNKSAPRDIIAMTQNHGAYVANVQVVAPLPMPAIPPRAAKQWMNKQDMHAIRFKSKINLAAADFAEATRPVHDWIETYEPGLLLTKRGQDDIHGYLEGLWKRCRCSRASITKPPRDWILPFWQKWVLYAICPLPTEKRRLFWICSPPEAGKGTLGEYLGDRDGWMNNLFPNTECQHPDVLNVNSHFTDAEKVALKYSDALVGDVPPGVLHVDFPKSVDTFSKAQLAGLDGVGRYRPGLRGLQVWWT